MLVAPCAFGKHLTNLATDEPVHCNASAGKFACPLGYNCVHSLPNDATFCCPLPPNTTTSAVDSSSDDGMLPSICEIFRDAAQGIRSVEPGYQLAIKNPRCNADVNSFRSIFNSHSNQT